MTCGYVTGNTFMTLEEQLKNVRLDLVIVRKELAMYQEREREILTAILERDSCVPAVRNVEKK